MNTIVREKCDLLIKNKDTLRQVFRLDGDMMMLAGSSFYVGIDVEAKEHKDAFRVSWKCENSSSL